MMMIILIIIIKRIIILIIILIIIIIRIIIRIIVTVRTAAKDSFRCFNGFIVIVIMSVILWLLCLSLLTKEGFNNYHG